MRVKVEYRCVSLMKEEIDMQGKSCELEEDVVERKWERKSKGKATRGFARCLGQRALPVVLINRNRRGEEAGCMELIGLGSTAAWMLNEK